MLGALGNGIKQGIGGMGRSLGVSAQSWMPRSRNNIYGWGPGGDNAYNNFVQDPQARNAYGDEQFNGSGLGQMFNQRKSPGQAGYNNYENMDLTRQIGEARGRDAYEWNNGAVGQQLRQAIDGKAMMDAQDKIRRAQRGESFDGLSAQDYLNSYRAIKDEDIAKHGVGAANMDRVGMGAGNQAGQQLRDYAARGGNVGGQLMQAANKEDYLWNRYVEGQYAPGSMSDPNTWLGHSSYNSMGLGAGQGNTNNDSVLGGDLWDRASGANGYERYLAMGGPDKLWNSYHAGNYSFGGGNYIGDKNYGSPSRGYDFQGPTPGGPSVGGYSTGTPDPGANLSRLIEHWTQNGISGRSLDQLIQMFGGTLPPTAQQDFDRRGYKPQIGTLEGYMNSPSKYVDYNSGWHGKKNYQAPRANPVSAESIGMHDNGLQRITNPIYDIPNGGAVGAPGRLSLGNDVFDQGSYGPSYGGATPMSPYQRLNSPFRNMADGFDNGYYGARTGAYMGNAVPRGGWTVR